MTWISFCSRHRPDDYDAECHLCQQGVEVAPEVLARGQALFVSDYATWYKELNETDEEPDDSAWATWERLTGKKRP